MPDSARSETFTHLEETLSSIDYSKLGDYLTRLRNGDVTAEIHGIEAPTVGTFEEEGF